MSVGERFKRSSQRLINRYGKTRVYIHKLGDGSNEYDPETQTVIPNETAYTLKMFKTEPKERELKSPNLVNRTTVVMMLPASDLPVRPKVGDEIRDQFLGVDEVYEVVQVKVNESADDIASWRLICVAS